MSRPPFTFYEFFAGGGMARLGLGPSWRCLFANDFDPVKRATYRANFGGEDFRENDVFDLTAGDLPGVADLAWASSPCQDFSLAGGRAGLAGGRSSALLGFCRLIEALNGEGRAPRMVVIENVAGLLTSHGGQDFAAVCRALGDEGYRFGALEIDAAHFLPQSRRRVFIVGAREDVAGFEGAGVETPAVRQARERLPGELRRAWVHWAAHEASAGPPSRPFSHGEKEGPAQEAWENEGVGGGQTIPSPSQALRGRAPSSPCGRGGLGEGGLPWGRNSDLAALLEADEAVVWRSEAETARLISLMDGRNREKMEAARTSGERRVGAVFRRVRAGEQRAEVRFDGLAGCLRTPRGGSSRQGLIVVEGGAVRSRLITPREAARLMGLPESYVLPERTNAALHVAGDGVAVPVVRWLAETVLEPCLIGGKAGLGKPQAA